MFKRALGVVVIFSVLSALSQLFAQKSYLTDSYNTFSKYYTSGDFINAERCLLNSLKSRELLSNEYVFSTYNNLGVINVMLGKYYEALNYYNSGEILIANQKQYSQSLADIYLNKARIYGILKESDKAIEYLEQGIKISLSIKTPNPSIYFRISSAYINLGLTYFEKKEYRSAKQYSITPPLFKLLQINHRN